MLWSQRGHRWQYNTTHALCMPGNYGKNTNTHIIAFPRQQRLPERASVLPYTYIVGIVIRPVLLSHHHHHHHHRQLISFDSWQSRVPITNYARYTCRLCRHLFRSSWGRPNNIRCVGSDQQSTQRTHSIASASNNCSFVRRGVFKQSRRQCFV
jgi:hypothetical protein